MLTDYYRKRASEYDTLYTAAAWQSELAVLRDWLVARVCGRTVLEVAAGTGYWTAVAAPMPEEAPVMITVLSAGCMITP
jgi:protein-L-isoaspartate O-methyltransferase